MKLYNANCKAAGLLVLWLFAATVNSAQLLPGTYQLIDHPDGAISPPPYGLRLDDLSPPAGPGPTFSTELGGAYVTLEWSGSNTALISGSLFNNTTGTLWRVEHTLTGVSSVTEGFVATGGSMVLADIVGGQSFLIESKADNSGSVFNALGDSHRCGGHADCGPFIGRGWLEPGVNDVGAQYNDWFVQLVPVPLPAAIFLFAPAVALLGLLSKGRQV